MLQAEDVGPAGGSNARWAPIYEALKSAILAHNLLPGTKLPEDELGEVYSVSRTVVRSALQALAHDRLVQMELNKSAYVAKPTPREAREVFEARALIEPKVAAMAAAIAKPADIVILRRHLHDEHLAIRENRNGDALLLSTRFHEAIAEIANHRIFTEFVRSLCSRSALIISVYWRRRDTFCESHAHDALVDAIEKNDQTNASDLMRSHLVDLLSGIDLSNREAPQRKLADILKPFAS